MDRKEEERVWLRGQEDQAVLQDKVVHLQMAREVLLKVVHQVAAKAHLQDSVVLHQVKVKVLLQATQPTVAHQCKVVHPKTEVPHLLVEIIYLETEVQIHWANE
jgi:hypothetical protein